MLRFLCVGNFLPGDVRSSWVPGTRRVIPEVESAIEAAWISARKRLGDKLFDGPMCRLESWEHIGGQLHLRLSPISYKPFVGTNMAHPEFAGRFGTDVMANPVGISPALHTADGFLLLGLRNQSVAYYPGRLHPFAGCLEPDDADVFSAVRRELAEELHLADGDISAITCTGIVHEQMLEQQELIFSVQSVMSRAQISQRMDESEHQAMHAVEATAGGIEQLLAEGGVGKHQLTPIAIASLLLWGRMNFGESWFISASAAAGLPRML